MMRFEDEHVSQSGSCFLLSGCSADVKDVSEFIEEEEEEGGEDGQGDSEQRGG